LFPIAIEIAHRYRVRTTASAQVGGGAEVACAIPQQDRHVIAVGHGEVLLAIAIEIAYGY